MEYFPPALENLVEHFAKLPGIGRKTAQRLAFYVLSLPQEEADAFAQSITQAKTAIHCCPVCQNLTEGEGPCAVCASPKRDHGVICVVADPKDVVAMERSREYHGLYHVLHGVISPMNHVGPDDLHIKSLVERVAAGGVEEVIMATNRTRRGRPPPCIWPGCSGPSRCGSPAWPMVSRWAATWNMPTMPPSCAPWRDGRRCKPKQDRPAAIVLDRYPGFWTLGQN